MNFLRSNQEIWNFLYDVLTMLSYLALHHAGKDSILFH